MGILVDRIGLYWNALYIIIVYDKSTDVIYCTKSLNYAIRN